MLMAFAGILSCGVVTWTTQKLIDHHRNTSHVLMRDVAGEKPRCMFLIRSASLEQVRLEQIGIRLSAAD